MVHRSTEWYRRVDIIIEGGKTEKRVQEYKSTRVQEFELVCRRRVCYARVKFGCFCELPEGRGTSPAT